MTSGALSKESLPPRAPRKHQTQLGKRLKFAWTSGIRELRKRFEDSLLGGLWLFLGPALLIGVYWAVFDLVVGIEFTDPRTGNAVPFLAAFAVGFFLYLTFSEMIGSSANWFKSKRRLVRESDLPVWTIFASLVARVFIQFLFYIAIVLIVCWSYGLATVQGSLLYIASSLLVFWVFAGFGLVTAYLGTFFGDVKEIVPVLMRILFYTSCITFPLTLVPVTFRWIHMINPLTWPVEMMRDLLLWDAHNWLQFLGPIFLIGLAIWSIALFFHWRLAPRLADIV